MTNKINPPPSEGEPRSGQEFSELVEALIDVDAARTIRAVIELNRNQVDPRDILGDCEKALDEIGRRFEEGEYFISGLIMAGTIMDRVIKLVIPRFSAHQIEIIGGKILIGTVQGDIHSLGKNIAGALLQAYGFEVRDLGVDVSAEEFIDGLREFQPLAVGLSVLLTSCFPNLSRIVEALRLERAENSRPYIFISGAQISKLHQKFFKADYQTDAAFDTVRLCQRLAKGDIY